MIATLRRLLLVSAGAIALCGSGLAQVTAELVVSLNVVYEPALVTGHAGGVGPAVMPALPVD